MIKASIIIPAYNEEANLPALYTRLHAVASLYAKYDFEFIFMDDHSTDKTPRILTDLRSRDERVHTIRFAQNSGSHAAIMAGLNHCRGAFACVIAADLQDPPELFNQFITRWEQGFKTVWAIRKKRLGESAVTLLCARIYYGLMNQMTRVKQAPHGADAFLIDRDVIDQIRAMPENNTSILMLVAWLGMNPSYFEYTKDARAAGKSKWTFAKKVKLFADSIYSFSLWPIRMITVTGLGFFGIGLLIGLQSLVNASPSILAWMFILSGIQLGMMGILGEYLWRTFDASRSRPAYVVLKNTLTEKNNKLSSV
jgi:dolichol-phosphate mannosyltransferase